MDFKGFLSLLEWLDLSCEYQSIYEIQDFQFLFEKAAVNNNVQYQNFEEERNVHHGDNTWNDVEGAVNSEATQFESVLLLSNSSNNLPHMPLKFYDEMIT